MLNFLVYPSFLSKYCLDYTCLTMKFWNCHHSIVYLNFFFSMPQNFEQGYLCMKFFISLGLILTVLWASDVVMCKAPSVVIWNTCFIIINSIYTIALIKKHFPTFLPSKLVKYYETVFKPFKISKKDFNILIKGARVETYIYGKHFCQGCYSQSLSLNSAIILI